MLSEYKTQLVHPDGDGGVVIETKQDCSDIVEQNKKEFNSFDERARWSMTSLVTKLIYTINCY